MELRMNGEEARMRSYGRGGRRRKLRFGMISILVVKD